MNQPGRSAATLPALGRVVPCSMLTVFLIFDMDVCAGRFPRREGRRMVWLPLGGAGAEGVRGGEEWKIAKESIGPLTPLGSSPAGEPPAYGYRHLSQVPFVSQPYLCLAAIDEPTRPLRGHPSSTRKGGALQHAYLFPYFRHGYVVQKDFTRQEIRRMVWLSLGGAGAEGVRGGRNRT